jgi:hypothetical protein
MASRAATAIDLTGQRLPNSDPPAVRVISDNSLYSAYERTADEVNIIGRIRWFSWEVNDQEDQGGEKYYQRFITGIIQHHCRRRF